MTATTWGQIGRELGTTRQAAQQLLLDFHTRGAAGFLRATRLREAARLRAGLAGGEGVSPQRIQRRRTEPSP